MKVVEFHENKLVSYGKMSIKWPQAPSFSVCKHLSITENQFWGAKFETFWLLELLKMSTKRVYCQEFEIKVSGIACKTA